MQDANNWERRKEEYVGTFCAFYSFFCKIKTSPKIKSVNKQQQKKFWN